MITLFIKLSFIPLIMFPLVFGKPQPTPAKKSAPPIAQTPKDTVKKITIDVALRTAISRFVITKDSSFTHVLFFDPLGKKRTLKMKPGDFLYIKNSLPVVSSKSKLCNDNVVTIHFFETETSTKELTSAQECYGSPSPSSKTLTQLLNSITRLASL